LELTQKTLKANCFHFISVKVVKERKKVVISGLITSAALGEGFFSTVHDTNKKIGNTNNKKFISVFFFKYNNKKKRNARGNRASSATVAFVNKLIALRPRTFGSFSTEFPVKSKIEL
jgi:hypothetical protein